MTPEEIEHWFWSARSKLSEQEGLPATWWPNTSSAWNHGTALAYAFFVEAARARCSGRRLTVAANAADATTEKRVIEKRWLAPPARDHSPHEVLVDFSVHNWDASSPIQLTGESEMWPYHGTGDSLESSKDDYSWDFYKLLVMPSTTRLFLARVGKTKGVETAQRIRGLVETLHGLIDFYAPALLRPHDELGVLVLPTRRSLAKEGKVLWLDRGRLWERSLQLPSDVSTDVNDEGDDDAGT